jgi:RNA polymerase sigma-70 factor, ECF subfamily
MTNELSDSALVATACAGDPAAFPVLVARHWLYVRRLLLAMLRYRGEVDDLLQEAFLEAYLNLDRLRQPERFRAWVCGIAINQARMWVRRRQRQPAWSSAEAVITAVPDPRPSPEQLAEQEEMAGRLQQALAGLSAAERQQQPAGLQVTWRSLISVITL